MYKMKTKKNTKSKNRKSLKNKLQKGGAGPYVPPHARRANPSHASRTSQPSHASRTSQQSHESRTSHPSPSSNIKNTFTHIKDTKIWTPTSNAILSSNENFYDWTDPNYGKKKVSVSGIGSVDWYLKHYIDFMKSFFDKYKIRSVVDIGCGDFLMGPRLYSGKTINYTGYDIVHSNIIDNNKKLSIQYKNLPIYKTKRDPIKNMSFEFIESDFTKEEDRETLKPADLCIIKDVLQHLNDARIIESVNALIQSNKYKYILICNNYIEDEFTSENIPTYPKKDIRGCFEKYEYNEEGKEKGKFK